MDEACTLHDIVYSQTKNITERHKANKVSEGVASQRLRSSNSTFGKKMAAIGVKYVMKLQREMGMCIKKIKKGRRTEKTPQDEKIPRRE